MPAKCTELPQGKFGSLEVIRIVKTPEHVKDKRTYYECKCECGNIKIISRRNFLQGRSSCGCRYRLGYKEISGARWCEIKRIALRRDIAFDITKQEIWEKFIQQNKKCALTGVELIFHDEAEKRTASLDRIDSSKGYNPENIQWVHKYINAMKNSHIEDKFIDLCRQVVEHADKRKLIAA